MTERPTTPAEALRVVARWFDIHYPQDINTEIQDDLRKWATEVELLTISETSLKLDNEVLSRRLAIRDRALADQEIRMDCVLCWKHAETHKSSIPCHKCQEEQIESLEKQLNCLAEAGTGYSQETMDAIVQERTKLTQELLESHQAYHKLRVENDEAQKTINYLRQQITITAADAKSPRNLQD
jgi:DNA repair exonuclease SbcCD ATPase subunit